MMEKMNIDRRMSLALLTREPEDDSRATKAIIEEPVKDGNQLVNVQDSIYNISEEHQSYSLLIACSNTDLLMLRYLWESFGSVYWVLSNFKCLMKQLVAQKWLGGIKMILESEVT